MNEVLTQRCQVCGSEKVYGGPRIIAFDPGADVSNLFFCRTCRQPVDMTQKPSSLTPREHAQIDRIDAWSRSQRAAVRASQHRVLGRDPSNSPLVPIFDNIDWLIATLRRVNPQEQPSPITRRGCDE